MITFEDLRRLLQQPQFTDEELDKLSTGVAQRINSLPASPSEVAHIKVSIELIRAIKRFDAASGRLVETTNNLTKAGLWLSGGALTVAVASLVVSAIALVK